MTHYDTKALIYHTAMWLYPREMPESSLHTHVPLHATIYAMTFGGTQCQMTISPAPETVPTRQCKALLAGMQTKGGASGV